MVAIRRDSRHMRDHCDLGPVRKKDPAKARIFPYKKQDIKCKRM